MADIEKVKQGLKAHTDECVWVCNENCPYYEPSEYGCCDNLIKDALSVIEKLQAEIERIKKDNELIVSCNSELEEQRTDFAMMIEKQRREIEKLKAQSRPGFCG